MLQVGINKDNYQYDVHSLVKAFFPEEDVKVLPKEASVLEEIIRKDEAQIQEELLNIEEKRIWILFSKDAVQIVFACQKQNADTEMSVLKCSISLSEDAFETTAAYKNKFKLEFYHMLSSYTGKKLPWGNLTGIRPTKLPMGMLDEGMSEAAIKERLQAEHALSDEKALLSIDIAKRERELMSTIHYQDGYSLYIGIPFCPTTCLYCSFTSYPIAIWRKRIQEYLDALEKEIVFTAEIYKDKVLDTVYMGGGTPTTLTAEELDRLLTKVKDSFDWSNVKEFTVEAGRADSITLDKLVVLKKHGVTRISVNPQTMNEDTLKMIGRRATAAQTKEAFLMAREAGFDNINMDIILGLPGEGVKEVTYTMDEILKLEPDSLTVHSLAIKRASKLSQWIQENGIEALHNTDETMDIAARAAKVMQMEPYYLYRQKNMSGNFENVGYAKPGKYGVYNILIMEEVQTIVALGAGSITKRVFPGGRIERADNVKDVEIYISRIDEMLERKRNLLTL